MLRPILAGVAALGLATGSSAQIFVPDGAATSGRCNLIPFGLGSGSSTTWANQKYHAMVTQTDLGNAQVLTICDLAFAACGTGIKHFDTIEIRLAQTSATVLSTTFSTNMVANVRTVLKAKGYEWHHTAGKWNRIGLDSDYNYIAVFGPNLVVEIVTTGCNGLVTGTSNGQRTGTTLKRIFAFGWTGSPPAVGQTDGGSTQAGLKMEFVTQTGDLQAFGLGCAGSAGTPALSFPGGATAKIGTSIGIDCSSCVASMPVLHAFGLTRYDPAVDLGFLGAPGCELYESPDIILGGVANASGVYSFKATLPNDKRLVCFRVYTQVFPFDPKANKWGYAASNYARILPGSN